MSCIDARDVSICAICQMLCAVANFWPKPGTNLIMGVDPMGEQGDMSPYFLK